MGKMKFSGIWLSAVMLVACGGSGSGSGGDDAPVVAPFIVPVISTAPVSIDTGNFVRVANAALSGSASLASSSGFETASVTSASSNVAMSSKPTLKSQVLAKIYDVAPTGLSQLGVNQSILFESIARYKAGYSLGVAAVTVSEFLSCDSGRILASASLADPDSSFLVAGDYITFLYIDCYDSFLGVTLNGELSTEVNSGEFNTTCFGYCSNFELTESMNNLQLEFDGTTLTSHGSYDITSTGNGMFVTMSGSSVYEMIDDEASLMTDFEVSLTEVGDTVSVAVTADFASTVLGGRISFTTVSGENIIWENDEVYPEDGRLTVTGAASSLEIDINGSVVDLYPNGDLTPSTYNWDDIVNS